MKLYIYIYIYASMYIRDACLVVCGTCFRYYPCNDFVESFPLMASSTHQFCVF